MPVQKQYVQQDFHIDVYIYYLSWLFFVNIYYTYVYLYIHVSSTSTIYHLSFVV